MVEIQMKVMDLAGELTESFGRANNKAIHQAIHGLLTKFNGDFNASELLEMLDKTPLAEVHWTFTSMVAMILITLVVFLVEVLI
jgi:hypothetical protein